GSTSGSATTAATASFQRARERASHHAIGVPTTSRRMVVINASASVSRIGDQSSSKLSIAPHSLRAVPALFNPVAEFLDHDQSLGALEEVEERTGGIVARSRREKHGVLPDGGVKICRNDPARSTRPLDHLGERDKAELGVAGVHELKGLRDVTTLHD